MCYPQGRSEKKSSSIKSLARLCSLRPENGAACMHSFIDLSIHSFIFIHAPLIKTIVQVICLTSKNKHKDSYSHLFTILSQLYCPDSFFSLSRLRTTGLHRSFLPFSPSHATFLQLKRTHTHTQIRLQDSHSQKT